MTLAAAVQGQKTPMSVEEARSLLVTHRAAQRAALSDAIARNPTGRLAKKINVRRLDFDIFDDRILEWGGDDAAIFFICAQVSCRVSLATIAEEYSLDYGMLWAWVTADKARYARYDLALKGVADGYFGEMVDIADGTTPDDVQVNALKIKTRQVVAAKYDKSRFGEKELAGGGGITVIVNRGGTEPPADAPIEISENGKVLTV